MGKKKKNQKEKEKITYSLKELLTSKTRDERKKERKKVGQTKERKNKKE